MVLNVSKGNLALRECGSLCCMGGAHLVAF